MTRSIWCVGILAALAAVAQPSHRKLKTFPAGSETIQSFISAPIYRGAHWGILIVDASTGRDLYQLNADQLFAPASVTKLFSGAAALVSLGSDFRFITPVYHLSVKNGNGEPADVLVLRASGDPNLSGRIDARGHLTYASVDHIYANFSNDATLTETDPLSGLDDLAVQIAHAGIGRIDDVLIDDRLFEPAEGSGSGPSRLSPVVVNDDVFDVLVTPTHVGEPANVRIRPSTSYAQWDIEVMTAEHSAKTDVNVTEISPRHYVVRGEIAQGRAPLLRIGAVDDPTEFARTLLIERLQSHGIAVASSRFEPEDRTELPNPGTYQQIQPIARHVSPPFSEALKVIFKTSHNLGAGLLPLIMAAQNGQRTMRAGMLREGEILRGLGVATDTISFGGPVGGDRADFVTPRSITTILKAMSGRSDAVVYRDALPILGEDGTLFDAVPKNSPARGKAEGKSGTLVWDNLLSGKSLLLSKALAGYMTAGSGRELLFALVVNNVQIDHVPEDVDAQERALGHLSEIIYRTY